MQRRSFFRRLFGVAAGAVAASQIPNAGMVGELAVCPDFDPVAASEAAKLDIQRALLALEQGRLQRNDVMVTGLPRAYVPKG